MYILNEINIHAMTKAENAIKFEHLLLTNIANIKIVRGPASPRAILIGMYAS